MAAEENIDKSKFDIGAIGDPRDPEVLIVSIPIRHYAGQGPDGLDMFYGKMKRLEAIGANAIRQHWTNKQKTQIKPGVILPDGKPAIIS